MMHHETILVGGELYVTIEAVAVCYEVEVAWLLEVHAYGLLEPTTHAGESLAVAVETLDRVARILQLHRQFGIDLAGIAHILGEIDRRGAR